MSANYTTEISLWSGKSNDNNNNNTDAKEDIRSSNCPYELTSHIQIKPPKSAEELGPLGGGRAPSPAITNAAAHPLLVTIFVFQPPQPDLERALERL